jgi:hypothetical protein
VLINLTGVTVQENYPGIRDWGVYVHRNCLEGVNQYTGLTDDPNVVFLQSTGDTCQFVVTNVKETDNFDLLFTDAANCDLKFKIQGLTLEYVSETEHKISPIVQIRNSYNVGLKSDTKVYRVSGVTINSNTTSSNIDSYISSGNLIETNVTDLTLGQTILSAELLPCSVFTSTDYELGKINNNYSFSYRYKTDTISYIDCLGSVKTSLITGVTANGAYQVFEILPTTKLRVFTNKFVDETNQEPFKKRKSYFFTSRSPEFLQIRPEPQEEPCCLYPSDYYDTGDFLITETGELIEVVSIDLNYCKPNLYYNINFENDLNDLIVFNGNDDHKLLIQHEYVKISVVDELNGPTLMDMSIQQFYTNDFLCPVIPTIAELERGPFSEICDIEPVVVCDDPPYLDCTFETEVNEIMIPTPTPTATPTPTPTPTPIEINEDCVDCGMEGYSFNKTN